MASGVEQGLLSDLEAADAIDRGASSHLTLDLMAGRATLGDVVGITDEEIEALYTLGYRYYCCGKYEHALSFFRFLCLHRHTDARSWLSLAAASQMLEDTEGAVQAYKLAALLNSEDPQIPLRAAECLVKLGRPAAAIVALGDVLTLSAGNSELNTFAWRARRMLDRLKTERNSSGA
ncbi:SycD/LcrH family type III secretion system chaperone [Bradyrhizobium sp. CCBAU 53421]|uniref:SycD/LcrH family type III secretion system chaperone n=1 Tax=Bradyrhizobium sp. CCBAU 53421 TaxID=1325120 RepID=UPI001889F74C|nr:SycD/LcrH family type III secretion system chaperone [Bradyrhizobium sp. CCBAU 53421]QOZ36253.1 CesD/SycD/LcrH family type III secretion system chaperone [Bradyrhizobium sp. CCBAU 53421]